MKSNDDDEFELRNGVSDVNELAAALTQAINRTVVVFPISVISFTALKAKQLNCAGKELQPASTGGGAQL